MKKDRIYWSYITKVLLEQFQYLQEAERVFRSYNLHYQIANDMAHCCRYTQVHDRLPWDIACCHNQGIL